MAVTDNFDSYSDNDILSTVSSDWTDTNGTIKVKTIGAPDLGFQGNTGSDWNVCYWAGTGSGGWSDDQYAQIVLDVLGVTWLRNGAAVRISTSAETYYGYEGASDATYLWKMVSGTYTQLGSTGGAPSADDVLYIEADGTTITPKLNGSTESPPGAQTDSSISSGEVGITAYHNSSQNLGDDFEGGDLVAGGNAMPMAMIHYKQRRK